jgi:hypothetical protein
MARWITKVTDTLGIPNTYRFSSAEILCDRALLLGYTHIAFLVAKPVRVSLKPAVEIISRDVCWHRELWRALSIVFSSKTNVLFLSKQMLTSRKVKNWFVFMFGAKSVSVKDLRSVWVENLCFAVIFFIDPHISAWLTKRKKNYKLMNQ